MAFDMKRNGVFLCFFLCSIFPLNTFGQKSIEKGFADLQEKNFGLANEHFRSGLKKKRKHSVFRVIKIIHHAGFSKPG